MITIVTDTAIDERLDAYASSAENAARRLRILLVEDSAEDAELIEYELRRSGVYFTVRMAGTREQFLRALRNSRPDVIIADYSLPRFSALDALRILKERNREIPFILVTGTQSEEVAMECVREGADDYILKQSLVRLPSALANAITKKDTERRKRNAERQLLTSNEQLRALSAHLQFIREEERALIAREIHDELGQTLTGIRMDVAWLQAMAAKRGVPEDQPLVDQLGSISRTVESSIRTVRRIATSLRPKVLDDLGLIAALEWQMDELQRRTGLRCRFRSNVREIALDQERATACFRIVQESLTNVVRHSQATVVTVRLRLLGATLTLEVSDNGRGITEAELANVKSLGILGMKERAFLLGGSVSVARGDHGGTTVRVDLPV
jgi:signal transduction histidine kinase